MPPDVFLVLASSGLTLVASLMFFVSDEKPPREPAGPLVDFCLPPLRHRAAAKPPPLPQARRDDAVRIRAPEVHGTFTLQPSGNEWVVTLDAAPLADTPAVRATDGLGAVHDLRWNVQAGIPKAVRRQWRLKPGRA